MADSSVAITAGSGTAVDTYQITGGDHQQVVREARALSESDDSWTVSTTAVTSKIAADASRVFVMMVSQANGRVYIRFDSTAPTASSFHWYLDPDERWELPFHLSTLAISLLGAAAGGTILFHLGVAG